MGMQLVLLCYLQSMLNFFISKAVEGEVWKSGREPWWFSMKDSLFWWLLLESKLCCDLLVLKLLEIFLLSSATMGICPESPLQLQYDTAVLAYVSEPLWSVSIFVCGLTWCSALKKQLMNVFFLVACLGFGHLLSAPLCRHWLFSFHSCLHTFFLSSFVSTKKTFLLIHLSL